MIERALERALERSIETTVERAPSYTGPLDLVPGADWLAAYSVTGALAAAMLGQTAVTIHRESDDATEVFLYNASTGNVDASAISTFLGASTGFYQVAKDNSGSGRDAINVMDITRQPIFLPDAINGFPAAFTSGTRDRFVASENNLVRDNTAWSLVTVCKFITEVGNGDELLGVNASGSFAGGIVKIGMSIAGDDVNMTMEANPGAGTGYAWTDTNPTPGVKNTYCILSFAMSQSVGVFRVNGVSIPMTQVNANAGGSVDAPIGVFLDDTINQDTPNVEYTDWLLSGDVLSTGDFELIEEYFAARYSITLP